METLDASGRQLDQLCNIDLSYSLNCELYLEFILSKWVKIVQLVNARNNNNNNNKTGNGLLRFALDG